MIEMVEEIQKKLASLGRRAKQLSRTGSTPQGVNRTGECEGFCG